MNCQTNMQNFTQKDLTAVKILQKVIEGGYFFETPCIHAENLESLGYRD